MKTKRTSKKKVKVTLFHNKVFLLLLVLSIVALAGIVFLVQQKHTLTQNAAGPTPPSPIGVSGNWNMIFDDEFDATSLNKTTWTPGWFGTGVSGPVSSS